ncbi:queuine tRNA ribosyl transferase [Besnoitia besnoiti]|uniref:Queuine tRNA ribosyl transferase n=1 Tax=Besnoitia besnoiti TaxID=94643 RepID=A0A2A9ML19_BESBE|nr:queuine tRNA ribosyl transferase [Besnoitia besnoiti]PFH36132.1 queuine tRNA ribosyl transferase [Besnoitia besnoiti]
MSATVAWAGAFLEIFRLARFHHRRRRNAATGRQWARDRLLRPRRSASPDKIRLSGPECAPSHSSGKNSRQQDRTLLPRVATLHRLRPNARSSAVFRFFLVILCGNASGWFDGNAGQTSIVDPLELAWKNLGSFRVAHAACISSNPPVETAPPKVAAPGVAASLFAPFGDHIQRRNVRRAFSVLTARDSAEGMSANDAEARRRTATLHFASAFFGNPPPSHVQRRAPRDPRRLAAGWARGSSPAFPHAFSHERRQADVNVRAASTVLPRGTERQENSQGLAAFLSSLALPANTYVRARGPRHCLPSVWSCQAIMPGAATPRDAHMGWHGSPQCSRGSCRVGSASLLVQALTAGDDTRLRGQPGRSQGGSAQPRVGMIRTLFGDVETPNFMVCGTKAAVKGITVEMLREVKTQIILANTYHLLVRPGPEVIESLGGLQHFTGWHGPMFTDSGGYQIFSLHYGGVADEVKGRRGRRGQCSPQSSSSSSRAAADSRRAAAAAGGHEAEGVDPSSHLLRLDETGAVFRSYYTGQRIELTPERAMETQYQLGADLIVALDECTPYHTSKSYTAASMRRSHRWALRCLVALDRLRDLKGSPPARLPAFSETPSSSQPPCRTRTNCPSIPQPEEPAVSADSSPASATWRAGRRQCPRCRTGWARLDASASQGPLAAIGVPYPQQGLYGVVQGGVYSDLREESVDFVNENAFFGTAIGGSLGATREQMHAVVAETARKLRRDRPIHLLGIGRMQDIFHGVKQGIDTFDCVHPTRAGRHGSALVPRVFWDGDGALNVPPSAGCDADDLPAFANFKNEPGRPKVARSLAALAVVSSNPEADKSWSPVSTPRAIFPVAAQRPKEYVDLRNAAFKFDDRPILPNCGCYSCKTASRAYLHYLLKIGEQLGGTLVTLHNIFTMNRLMASIRQAIVEKTLDEEKEKWIHPLMKD